MEVGAEPWVWALVHRCQWTRDGVTHEQLLVVVSVLASESPTDDWPSDGRHAGQRRENNLPFTHTASLPYWWSGRHLFPSRIAGTREVRLGVAAAGEAPWNAARASRGAGRGFAACVRTRSPRGLRQRPWSRFRGLF